MIDKGSRKKICASLIAFCFVLASASPTFAFQFKKDILHATLASRSNPQGVQEQAEVKERDPEIALSQTVEDIVQKLRKRGEGKKLIVIGSSDTQESDLSTQMARALSSTLTEAEFVDFTDTVSISNLDRNVSTEKDIIILARDYNQMDAVIKKYKGFREKIGIAVKPNMKSRKEPKNEPRREGFHRVLSGLKNVDILAVPSRGWAEDGEEAKRRAEADLRIQRNLELVGKAFQATKGGLIVPGGAGFIGSRLVHLAVKQGIPVLVLDSFENGHAGLLPDSDLVTFKEVNIRDYNALKRAVDETETVNDKWVVIGYAAYIEQEESMKMPQKYQSNNPPIMVNLARLAEEKGLDKVILSSTAAAYAVLTPEELERLQAGGGIQERWATPKSAYGTSKTMEEDIVYQFVEHMRKTGKKIASIIFRYFNVFGPGEAHPSQTHLTELAASRDKLKLFGTKRFDPETGKKGDVRDYIDVRDLATAHLFGALRLMILAGDLAHETQLLQEINAPDAFGPSISNDFSRETASNVFNLGSGKGYRTEEILEMAARMRKQYGDDLEIIEQYELRAEGESEFLNADATKAEATFGGWQPTFSIQESMADTMDWFQKLGLKRAEWEERQQPDLVPMIERTEEAIRLIKETYFLTDAFRLKYAGIFLIDMLRSWDGNKELQKDTELSEIYAAFGSLNFENLDPTKGEPQYEDEVLRQVTLLLKDLFELIEKKEWLPYFGQNREIFSISTALIDFIRSLIDEDTSQIQLPAIEASFEEPAVSLMQSA